MKRAEVWKDRSSETPVWSTGFCHWRDRDPSKPIHLRPDYIDNMRCFYTHAEALAYALAEIGHTPKEQNR